MTSDHALTTCTGREVDPFTCGPDDLDLVDIAHALALTCRFGGHSWGHLSVARHSIHVADELPDHLRLCGLLHDAAEAYLGDIPSPIKHAPVFDAYRVAEARLERVIAAAFDLPHPMPALVKAADVFVNAWECDPVVGDRHVWNGDWRTDMHDWLTAVRLAQLTDAVDSIDLAPPEVR